MIPHFEGLPAHMRGGPFFIAATAPLSQSSAKDAEVFATHFEGAHFDPIKDREKGKVCGAWLRTDEWKPTERCGPLELPRFFREYER